MVFSDFRFRCRQLAALVSVILLAACSSPEETEEAPPVRGLKVFEVSAQAATMVRRYPSVVQPADESRLSFEISGQLTEVSLDVGVAVRAGDLLLTIDPTTLKFEMQQAKAALEQAEANLSNARTDFDRKEALLATGNVTQAAYDSSDTTLRSTLAQVEQSRQQFAIAGERLEKTEIRAPFDGVISSVDVKSFANVSAGQTALTLYSENAFEVEFSVPASVINDLKTGDNADVVITDLPNTMLGGRIKELGSRGGQVSAFPAVVILEESHPGLKAGMAAEVSLMIRLLQADEGFLVPVHCFALERSLNLQQGESVRDVRGGESTVFVFDAATSTVSERTVQTAGVRDNMVIVVAGLAEGDIVAAAGVSYLTNGQKVRRLPQAR